MLRMSWCGWVDVWFGVEGGLGCEARVDQVCFVTNAGEVRSVGGRRKRSRGVSMVKFGRRLQLLQRLILRDIYCSFNIISHVRPKPADHRPSRPLWQT